MQTKQQQMRSGLQMTTLNKILSEYNNSKFATDTGTQMHKVLQHVTTTDDTPPTDNEIINKIHDNPTLIKLFGPNSQTEVPIAGTIKNKFISRRIDRLLINHKEKTIDILDYKTDTIREKYLDIYTKQITEYALLLHAVYPDYQINGYILWTHDFSLEKISINAL